MSVKKDPSGRRSVEAEIEVPGTPEEVWAAIATGPGVSSWFVPTETRDDGTVVCNFGPGMESVSTRTAWEPPHRFAAEGTGFGPNAPPLATEWIVEARDGGKCVVRVVHSLFASTDDWDDQLESIESGWPTWFVILGLYLRHFRGLPCSTFRVMGVTAGPASAAWEALAGSLGVAGLEKGQTWDTPAGLPALSGVVERVGTDQHHQAIVRFDGPAPGVVLIMALAMGGQVLLSLHFYLYGDRAAEAAARDEPSWQAWLSGLFPAAGNAGLTC